MSEIRLCACKKKAAPGRTECNTCKSRKWINKNRVAFAYHMIKKSAKRRRIPFTITLEYFTSFVNENGYMQNSGRLGHQMTIDRVDGSRGYEEGNLKCITRIENSRKYHNKQQEYPNHESND